MSAGSIIKREGARGTSYLIKYDAGHDPVTGKRLQRYATCTGTKREAQAELRRLLGEVDTGQAVDPTKMTTGEWLQTWLRDHATPNVTQRSVEYYKMIIDTKLVPGIGHVPVQKLTGQTIQALYSKLMESGNIKNTKKAKSAGTETDESCGLAAQTVVHVHRTLFRALKIATKQKVIVRNPAEDATPPSLKKARATSLDSEDSGQIKALERNEIKALFRSMKENPLLAMVVVATGTGARRGELLALKWSDVDFSKRTLCISKALEETAKFGVRIKPPKNESSRRTIVIDEGLCQILKAHRNRQEELATAMGVLCPADCLIFPCSIRRAPGRQPRTQKTEGLDFSRWESPNAVSKLFGRAAKDGGFPDLTMHDLRHTHATQLLQGGVPVHVVAQRLGHASPMVTMTVYAHVLKRADDQASQIAGEMIRQALGVG